MEAVYASFDKPNQLITLKYPTVVTQDVSAQQDLRVDGVASVEHAQVTGGDLALLGADQRLLFGSNLVLQSSNDNVLRMNPKGAFSNVVVSGIQHVTKTTIGNKVLPLVTVPSTASNTSVTISDQDFNNGLYSFAGSVGSNEVIDLFKAEGGLWGGEVAAYDQTTNEYIYSSSNLTFPPRDMTGNLDNITGFSGQEGTYSATASSFLAVPFRASFPPNYAFRTDRSSWLSATGLYDGSGNYTGATVTTYGSNTYAGEWLQLDLPVETLPKSFNIAVTPSNIVRQNEVKDFAVFGSTDGVAWDLLGSYSNEVFDRGVARTFNLPATTNLYTKLRIAINKITKYVADTNCAVYDLRFYGQVETLLTETIHPYTGAATTGGFSGEWVQVVFPGPVTVQQQTIEVPSDITGLAPSSFRLYGSSNGTSWTAVNEQTNVLWNGPLTQTFSFNNTQAYQWWRLAVRSGYRFPGLNAIRLFLKRWVLLGKPAEQYLPAAVCGDGVLNVRDWVDVQMNKADVRDLTVAQAQITTLNVEDLITPQLNALELAVTNAAITNLTTPNLQASSANVTSLTSQNSSINSANVTSLTAQNANLVSWTSDVMKPVRYKWQQTYLTASTLTAATELNVPLDAISVYHVRAQLVYNSSATGVGFQYRVGLTGAVGSTAVAWTGRRGSEVFSANAFGVGPNYTTNVAGLNQVTVEMYVFTNTANTLQLSIGPNTAGTVTLLLGSHIEWTKLNTYELE